MCRMAPFLMTLDDPNCRNCFRFSLLVEFGSRSIISEYMIGSFSGIDDCCEIELRCITQGMLPWQPMLCCTECSNFAAQCWNSCIPPLCQNRSKQLQQLHSQMQYVHLRATNTERPQNLPLCSWQSVAANAAIRAAPIRPQRQTIIHRRPTSGGKG